MEDTIKVYVQVNSNNVITNMLSNIESSITEISIEGWVQIDEGTGDKYSHAQGNYFTIDGKKPLMDEKFRYNYKLVDGKPVELTEEEKEKLFPTKAPQPSIDELVNAIQNQQKVLNNLTTELQYQIDIQNI